MNDMFAFFAHFSTAFSILLVGVFLCIMNINFFPILCVRNIPLVYYLSLTYLFATFLVHIRKPQSSS